MIGGNALRIPFAEWLYRMTEADLPYQARTLAVYAAVFKISSNDELGQLAGMASPDGGADRTYDKWKRRLLTDGWVVISRRKGGRGVGVEVSPAFRETPVTFTDIVSRNPGKYYPRNEEVDTGVIIAETAEVTGVEIAPAKEKSPHTPLKENTTSKLASYESGEPSALAGLNGSAEPMLDDIVKWMVGGDVAAARKWLANFIHTHGQEVVRDSYLKLGTDLLSGSVIARPLQTWSTIATRMRREPKAGGAAVGDSPSQSKDEKIGSMVEKAMAKAAAEKGARRQP